MHQILSLREFFDEKKQQWDKTDTRHFKDKWTAPSIPDLYKAIDELISKVPEAERYNLFYTVAFCSEKKREFREQHVLMFDIDGLGDKAAEEPKTLVEAYLPIVAGVLGVKPEVMAAIFSGNGLHFTLLLEQPIAETTFFNTNRRHYNAICEKVNSSLAKAGLPGNCDPAVFDPRRIMRLPGTLNRKEGRPERLCVLVKPDMVAQPFKLSAASGLPQIEAEGQVSPAAMRRFPTPDTQAILQGCEFLKWMKASPNDVRENQWYAGLSVLGRLSDGRAICHDYSRGHSGYSPGETDAKIDQALQASGPRTCGNLNDLAGKCAGCKFQGKVASPIMIQSASYIKTKDSGFHNLLETKDGDIKVGKPNFKDLVLYYDSLHPYVTLGDSGICLTWTGTHWEEVRDKTLESFAQAHFNPTALTWMTTEFKNLISRTNIRKTKWFTETTARKINFANGVLDIDTMELAPHSPEYGFRSVLQYDYAPGATAPAFEKFMTSVTDSRAELSDVLMEFAGYSFSNDECWAEKALLLTGEGANGKSTFLNVLKKLAGDDNCSKVTLDNLKDPASRQMLEGCLFNIAEETPTNAMADSGIFKNLVSGGDTPVKVLYKQPYTIAVRTKLIFACNELPRGRDTSHGFFRKLLIVPFDKRFDGAEKDPYIKQKLFQELPGIFNLVIAAYKRLKERGHFIEDSEAMLRQMDEYQAELDTVRSWFEASLTVKPLPEYNNIEQPITTLYSSYSGFCQARGEKPETATIMSRRLSSILKKRGELSLHRKDQGKNSTGRRERIYRGLQLNDGAQY